GTHDVGGVTRKDRKYAGAWYTWFDVCGTTGQLYMRGAQYWLCVEQSRPLLSSFNSLSLRPKSSTSIGAKQKLVINVFS
ncbi:hypothetical protein A2U01_0068036, partial [Trifolium medium]|nr:hypothetical protein [Trifolium medium]